MNLVSLVLQEVVLNLLSSVLIGTVRTCCHCFPSFSKVSFQNHNAYFSDYFIWQPRKAIAMFAINLNRERKHQIIWKKRIKNKKKNQTSRTWLYSNRNLQRKCVIVCEVLLVTKKAIFFQTNTEPILQYEKRGMVTLEMLCSQTRC